MGAKAGIGGTYGAMPELFLKLNELIAEKDLEIRGTGEILGTKQTGSAEFKVANLMRDRKIIPLVQRYAKQIIVENPPLAEALIKRWLNEKAEYTNA